MILPTSYFPSILQYSMQIKGKTFLVEAKENFIKQSYRSRCEIYGANGKLTLVVPVKKWRNHAKTEEIEVSFDVNWQNIHWKGIESAYRTSPYFEFYEDEIKPLFYLPETNLLRRNNIIIKELNSIINNEQQIELTEEYLPQKPDYRILIHPNKNLLVQAIDFKPYIQVFEDKGGFIPNLSILDLIFNLGPDSKTYLNNLTIPN